MGVSRASIAACSRPRQSSSDSSAKISAACKLDSPPKSEAKAPEGGATGKASGKVGVILPDTTSSVVYRTVDGRPVQVRFVDGEGDVVPAGDVRPERVR